MPNVSDFLDRAGKQLIQDFSDRASSGHFGHRDSIKNVQVMEWAVNHSRVARGDVITLLQVTPDQAYKILERMCSKGKLLRQGKGRRGSYYTHGYPSKEQP